MFLHSREIPQPQVGRLETGVSWGFLCSSSPSLLPVPSRPGQHGERSQGWRRGEEDLRWHQEEEELPLPRLLHQGREDDLRGEDWGAWEQLQWLPPRPHDCRPRRLQVKLDINLIYILPLSWFPSVLQCTRTLESSMELWNGVNKLASSKEIAGQIRCYT